VGDETSNARSVPILWPHEGMTIADVDALSERDGMRHGLVDGVHYELVDGALIALSTPSIEHQDALFAIHVSLRATAPAVMQVVQGVGVVLAEDQRAAPDLVVVAHTPDRALSNIPADHVALVAEVVSTSTRSTDRHLKHGLYSQAGIPCYLRVELDPLHIVAYRLGDDGVYEEAGRAEPGEVLTLTEPFPITIDPAALAP
jgi:Uma2 family endonuclease